jgi:hypothetical protein
MLTLTSFPEGADVYINHIRYPKVTPCSVNWDVGDSCRIEMRRDGYEDLTGLRINTVAMVDEIDDRRLWNVEIENEPEINYQIHGLFGKHIRIFTQPPKAKIYLDGQTDAIAEANSSNSIYLTAGKHRLKFTKKGFNSKTISLKVGAKSPEELNIVLTRPVRFAVQDSLTGESMEATISELRRSGKIIQRDIKIPGRLNLQPYPHTAFITKPGYREVTFRIPSAMRRVDVLMEPLTRPYSIVVLDEETGTPIENATIQVTSLDDSTETETIENFSDSEGLCSGSLQPGLYMVQTSKEGYQYFEKSIIIKDIDLNLIELTLSRL